MALEIDCRSGIETLKQHYQQHVPHIRIVRGSSSPYLDDEYVKRLSIIMNKYSITTDYLEVESVIGTCHFDELLKYINNTKEMKHLSMDCLFTSEYDVYLFLRGLYGNQSLRKFYMYTYTTVYTINPCKIEEFVLKTGIYELVDGFMKVLSIPTKRELIKRMMEDGCTKIDSRKFQCRDRFIKDIITHLRMYNNPITTVLINKENGNYGSLFYQFILLNCPIREISLTRIHFSSQHYSGLLSFISEIGTLESFELTSCGFNDERFRELVECLRCSPSNYTLTRVSLNGAVLRPPERTNVLENLIMGTGITHLRYDSCYMCRNMLTRIETALHTPIDERYIEVKSFSKSAAKR